MHPFTDKEREIVFYYIAVAKQENVKKKSVFGLIARKLGRKLFEVSDFCHQERKLLEEGIEKFGSIPIHIIEEVKDLAKKQDNREGTPRQEKEVEVTRESGHKQELPVNKQEINEEVPEVADVATLNDLLGATEELATQELAPWSQRDLTLLLLKMVRGTREHFGSKTQREVAFELQREELHTRSLDEILSKWQLLASFGAPLVAKAREFLEKEPYKYPSQVIPFSLDLVDRAKDRFTFHSNLLLPEKVLGVLFSIPSVLSELDQRLVSLEKEECEPPKPTVDQVVQALERVLLGRGEAETASSVELRRLKEENGEAKKAVEALTQENEMLLKENAEVKREHTRLIKEQDAAKEKYGDLLAEVEVFADLERSDHSIGIKELRGVLRRMVRIAKSL